MNQQAFEAGKAAYRQGNLTEAMTLLSDAKLPGEVSGSVDHMLGNCLMKMGRYMEAAAAYADALRDPSYGNTGALACNRGRALLAAGKPQEAIASLTMATKDESYATPYKAYIALGNAYLKLGNAREAGVAFRNAAIDEANPEPAGALRSLGNCFMQLGRAVDAIEAYRTALDFSTPLASQNAIHADLGMAYVAANRMPEAVDAFSNATADGTYVLGPEFQAAFDAAKRAVTAVSSGSPSETDAMLFAAGYGAGSDGSVKSYDPLDPMGKSGEFMPSPEDTGFFSITEEEIVEGDRRDRKKKRKKKHGCLRFFIILLLLGILFGGVGYSFYRGFGWPTANAVAEELFTKGDLDAVVASGVDEAAKTKIASLIPASSSNVKVTGKNANFFNSKVFATVTLAAGGEQSYQIDMVREGIGWKVADLSLDYASQEKGGAMLTTPTAGSTTTSTTQAQPAPTNATPAGTDDQAASGTEAEGADASETGEEAAASE